MPDVDPDLLRLVAVPVLGWAAYRDVKVRRVPNRLWLPLYALGLALLVWEAARIGMGTGAGPAGVAALRWRLFVVQTAVSLGIVIPLAYLVWRLGGWGGADMKALVALALVFPTTPAYVVSVPGPELVFPMTATTLGAFSLTILTNTVVVAMVYPLVLAGRNLLAGDLSLFMFVGTRVPCASVPERHGSLLETPDGRTTRGLDIDALRMYLRWRDASLAELRADPEHYRDPASLPDEPGDPGDGAIADGGERQGDEGAAAGRRGPSGAESPDRPAAEGTGGTAADQPDDSPGDATTPGPGDRTVDDDPWGAEAFLESVPHAWGTTPEALREGLTVLVEQDAVWYSPGTPYIVPMFIGLVVSLVYGDLLVSAMLWLGIA